MKKLIIAAALAAAVFGLAFFAYANANRPSETAGTPSAPAAEAKHGIRGFFAGRADKENDKEKELIAAARAEAEAIKPNEGIGFWSGHCPGIGIMDYSVFAEKRDNVIVYTFHKEWGVSTDWNQKILMTYEKPVLPEAPTAALPVLDMLAKGDTTRLLIADDTDIVYAEINDGGPEPVVKKKSIYTFRRVSSPNSGRVIDAEFVAPDVVRIANSSGAAYDIKTAPGENGSVAASLIWKNGRGEDYTNTLSYPDDKPVVSAKPPVYEHGLDAVLRPGEKKIVFSVSDNKAVSKKASARVAYGPEEFGEGDYKRLGARTREAMFEKLGKNFDILKVDYAPSEPPEEIKTQTGP
ncbi:MAG: hypothetical protein ILO36_07385 [Abditibacteriota bacterium]|nr:hypothetical protein [Abditibacteriota bacterium]